ncbi:tetratricopeptide repeat protein [Rhizosaccharibacter radicis]|uniref:Tetratricopeptide repeat protein n=1 Tax=Rhizosaccharibacter radicis TaxID=2782605 RepID=A0ABT1W026_9PROT|nr:tetratricopeptide repeat protein [Acetobacteraceae bacterium KSS12]
MAFARSMLASILPAASAVAATVRPSHAAAPAPEPPRVAPGTLGPFLAGSVANELGDDEEAAQELARALAADPDDPVFQREAFLFAAAAGSPGLAALVPRGDDTLLGHLALADEAARKGNWPEAERLFGDLPRSPLNDLMRPILVAWAQQGGGHTDLALQTLAAPGTDNPFGALFALNAGEIATLAGRQNVAGEQLRMAQTLYAGNNVALTEALGRYLAGTGHILEAQAMVHALGRQIPLLGMVEGRLDAALALPLIADAKGGIARAYLGIAGLLQEQARAAPGGRGADPGNAEAEGFLLRFAIAMQPDLAPARLMLAELQLPDHPDAAIRILDGIPPTNPFEPLARLRRATLLGVSGHPAEARRLLEQLAHDLPQRPEPLQSLGDVLQDAKDWHGAADAYGRAIAVRGTLGHDDWPLLFSRAVAFDRGGDWPRAEADLQRAIRLAPDQPLLLNYLGYSLTERNRDLPQAQALIQRALDGKPDDGSIRDSLGWVLLRRDDVPGAVRVLEHAAEQTPEDPTVNYHLGVAYWMAGRRVEAEQQWHWALLLHPDPADASRIQSTLEASAGSGARPGTPLPPFFGPPMR